MPPSEKTHFYLPERDRSFWKGGADLNLPFVHLV
jgi:hypothetical protein